MSESIKATTPPYEPAITAYMMASWEQSVRNSMRLESRGDRAIQLFLTLFTALAGGGVVAATTVQDAGLKYTILALDLVAITGMGALTYAWVLASTLEQNKEWVQRFHIQRFFHDLAPDVMQKYGRDLVLQLYQDALYRKGIFLGGMSAAVSFSLIVFAIFDSLTAVAAVYMGLLALIGTATLLLPVIVGILCLSASLAALWLGLKDLQRYRDAGRKIVGG
jgi:hypothetical protein